MGLGEKLKKMIYESDESGTKTPEAPTGSTQVESGSAPKDTAESIPKVTVDEQKLNQIVSEMRTDGRPLTDFLNAVKAIKDIVAEEEKRFQAVAKTHSITSDILLRAAQDQYSSLERIKDEFSDEVKGRTMEVNELKKAAAKNEESIKNLREQIKGLETQEKNILAEAEKKENIANIAKASFDAVVEAAEKLLDSDVEKIKKYLKGGEK